LTPLVPAEAGTQAGFPLEFTPDVIGGGNERELGFTCERSPNTLDKGEQRAARDLR